MGKFLKILKNKYALTALVFVLYGLFLDDIDIFSIVRQKRKLTVLSEQKEITSESLKETKILLNQLKHRSELEKFARERKLFKKDGEDVFVISYE